MTYKAKKKTWTKNGPERLWNVCLGDTQNAVETLKFQFCLEQVAGQDDLQRSLPA